MHQIWKKSSALSLATNIQQPVLDLPEQWHELTMAAIYKKGQSAGGENNLRASASWEFCSVTGTTQLWQHPCLPLEWIGQHGGHDPFSLYGLYFSFINCVFDSRYWAEHVMRLKTFLKSWKQEIRMKSGDVTFWFLSNLRIFSAKNIINWQIGRKVLSTTIGDIEIRGTRQVRVTLKLKSKGPIQLPL